MTGRRNAILKFVKLTENAFSPIKLSPKSAGYDLRRCISHLLVTNAYDLCVPPHGKELVKIDIKVQLPEGCYGRIAPRSGLALNYHIDIGAGVIDEDYRGNIGVVLFNHSDKEFVVKRGDRIAQLICEQILHPELEEVQELDDTQRGSMGLGSTGIK